MRKHTSHLTLTLVLICLTLGSFAKERVHFVIPGGAGGGWDTTARGVGDALIRSGIVETTSYENISGGGGSKAIAYMIETAERQQNSMMISSTPIILQSLRGIFPQTYKDLEPVAAVVADYGAFVVKNNSPYQSWQDVTNAFNEDPRNVKVAGGSMRGSMDHLVAALAFFKSGVDVTQLRYIPYNAGAKAMVGLLSEETQLLSTGLSEAIALAEQGEVRILAMTAETRQSYAKNIPTLIEQNIDVKFTNWRGFFAAPGIPKERLEHFREILTKMSQEEVWEEIRNNRGWTNLNLKGPEFINYLAKQEQELNHIMVILGLKGD